VAWLSCRCGRPPWPLSAANVSGMSMRAGRCRRGVCTLASGDCRSALCNLPLAGLAGHG
jgi:hypothetical protein